MISWLFTSVQKQLQISASFLGSCRQCSPFFEWVSVELVSAGSSIRVQKQNGRPTITIPPAYLACTALWSTLARARGARLSCARTLRASVAVPGATEALEKGPAISRSVLITRSTACVVDSTNPLSFCSAFAG